MLPFISSVLSLIWGMNVQNYDMTLVMSKYYIRHPITNKQIPFLTADMVFLHTKIMYLIHTSQQFCLGNLKREDH
jgi:hypothetical protein